MVTLLSYERLKTYFQISAQEICTILVLRKFAPFSHFEAAITQKSFEKPG